VPWEASNDERILDEARWEIARSVAWGLGEEPPPPGDGPKILDYLQTKAPPVYDPFCGGGSIPLEAQRLGLRAYGSDLNPVAVLISKALVEIPPKFAGLPPVNPEAQAALRRGGTWNGKGAQGLAEDVRYYGNWMRDEAEKRIGHLYPKAQLPDGTEATVIAWLWARTVRSPDPAAKGAMVPLVSSFMLSTKEGKKAWVEPVIDPAAPNGYRFEVQTGKLSKADEERLKKGTKSSRGNFTCLLSGAAIPEEWNRGEGKAKRLSVRLMAVVAEGQRGRIYLPPVPEHEAAAANSKPAWEPEGELFRHDER
jgi:putative DNA methylase